MTSIVFTPTPPQNHRYISFCQRNPNESKCKINPCRKPIQRFSDKSINFAPDSKLNININTFNGNKTKF